ncbi:hypothetical protein PsYK624_027260 [Phanerochaete sordida]|uniref:Uncharacterized protein n=1 Tax=Phanerochaete sordida TaxID=48140 RepID=A0A9P3G2E1_9APHY|nr:hypothetical protein PsYK624_027260 [Phanerochaete sordida]
MEQLQERERKSCTLVIWFENGKGPRIISHHVPSYPYLVPLSVDALISKDNGFGLSPSSFIQYYSGTWVTLSLRQQIRVNSDHEVLFRLLPSFREELCDCPDLEDYQRRQPQRHGPAKRLATQLVSPSKKARASEADSPSSHIDTHRSSPVTPTRRARSPDLEFPPILQILDGSEDSPSGSHAAPLPDLQRPIAPLPKRVPSHRAKISTATAKRQWPADYTLQELLDGFSKMQEMLKIGEVTTEKAAFPTVFSSEYRKSTVTRSKKILREASNTMKTKHALTKWSDFLKALKPGGNSDAEDDALVIVPSESPSLSCRPTPVSSGPSKAPQPVLDSGPSCLTPTANPTLARAETPNPFVDTGDMTSLHGESFSSHPDFFQAILADPDLLDDSADWERLGIPYNLEELLSRCLFCDKMVTSTPSPYLQQLLADLVSDPNPPSMAQFLYCQRHELETSLAPEAQAKGWPLDIDFSQLRHRTLRSQAHLKSILQGDITENAFYNLSAKDRNIDAEAGLDGVSGSRKPALTRELEHTSRECPPRTAG